MSDDFDFFALVAAGGNSRAARSARAKLQWRDRYGRWIEMGRGVKFKVRFPDGAPRSVVGKFVGATDPDTGQLYVSKDPNGLPDGFYKVKSDNAQEFLADLTPEQLKSRGIEQGKDANGKVIGERMSENIPNVNEIERLDAPEGWTRLPGTFAGKHVIETEDGDFRIHFGGKDNKWAVEDVRGAPGQATAYSDAGDAFKQVSDLDLEREESGDTAYTGLEKDNDAKLAQLGRDDIINAMKLNERTITNDRASIDAKQRAMNQNAQYAAELEGKGFDPYDPEGADSDDAIAARKADETQAATPRTTGAIDTKTFGVEPTGFLVPTGKKTNDISPQGLADHVAAEIEHYSEGGKRIVIDTDNNEAEGYNSAEDFNDAKAQAGGVGADHVLDLAASKSEPVEPPSNVDDSGDNTPRADQEAPDAEVRSSDAQQPEGAEPESTPRADDNVGGEAEPAEPASPDSGARDDTAPSPDSGADSDADSVPSEPDGTGSEPSPDSTPSHAPGSLEELQERRNQLQAALENSGDPKDMVALNDQIDELDNRIAAKSAMDFLDAEGEDRSDDEILADLASTPEQNAAKERDEARPDETDGESPADAPERFQESTVPADAEQPDDWEPKEGESALDWLDRVGEDRTDDEILADLKSTPEQNAAKEAHPETAPDEEASDQSIGEQIELIENEQRLLESDRDKLWDQIDAMMEPEDPDDIDKLAALHKQYDEMSDRIKDLDQQQYDLLKGAADRYVAKEVFDNAMKAEDAPVEEHPESVVDLDSLREETLAALAKQTETGKRLHAVNEQLLDDSLDDEDRATLQAQRDVLQARFEDLDAEFAAAQSRFQRAKADSDDLTAIENADRNEKSAQADADREALRGIEDASREADGISGLEKMDNNQTDSLTEDEINALDVEDAGWASLLANDAERGAKWAGMDPDQIAGGTPYLNGQPDFYAIDQNATNALAKVNAWMADPERQGTWEGQLSAEEYNAFQEAHARDAAWVEAYNTWKLEDQPAWSDADGRDAWTALNNALDQPTRPEQIAAIEALRNGMSSYEQQVFDRDIQNFQDANPSASRIGPRPDPLRAEAERLEREARLEEAREKAIAEREARLADPRWKKMTEALRGTKLKIDGKKLKFDLIKGGGEQKWLNTKNGQWLTDHELYRLFQDDPDAKFSYSAPDPELLNADMTREEWEKRIARIDQLEEQIANLGDNLEDYHPDSQDAQEIQDKLWDAENEYNDLVLSTPDEDDLVEPTAEEPAPAPSNDGAEAKRLYNEALDIWGSDPDEKPFDMKWLDGDVDDDELPEGIRALARIVAFDGSDPGRTADLNSLTANDPELRAIFDEEVARMTGLMSDSQLADSANRSRNLDLSRDVPGAPAAENAGVEGEREARDPLLRLEREQQGLDALDEELRDAEGDALRATMQEEAQAAADQWAAENNIGNISQEDLMGRLGELNRLIKDNIGEDMDDEATQLLALGDELVKRERANRAFREAETDMLEADLAEPSEEEAREIANAEFRESPEGLAETEESELAQVAEENARRVAAFEASLAADGYQILTPELYDGAESGDTALDTLSDIEYTHNGTAFVNDDVDEEIQPDFEGIRKNDPINGLRQFIFKKNAQAAEPTPKAPGTPYLPALGAGIGRANDIFKGKDNPQGVLDALRGEDVFMIDFETTGFTDLAVGANETNQPVQLGIVHMRNGEEVGRLNLFMNPGEPLGEFSKNSLIDPQGNPLTDEYLATQPSIKEAMQQAVDFIGPNAILGGQNTQFDTEILRRSLKESGIDFEWDGTLDSKAMADVLLPREEENGDRISRSLDPLRKWLNNDLGNEDIAEGNWHEATSDALKSYQIMESLLNRAIRDNQDVSALADDPSDKNRQKYAETTFPKYLNDLESYLRATGKSDQEIEDVLREAESRYNPVAIDQHLGLYDPAPFPEFTLDTNDAAEIAEVRARNKREANQVPSDVAIGDILVDENGDRWEVIGIDSGEAGIANKKDPANIRRIEIGEKGYSRVEAAPVHYSAKSKNIQAERNADPYSWALRNPEKSNDRSYRTKLEALAAGKDLTLDEQLNVAFMLHDPNTSTDELIDIERMLTDKPNAANTATKPREIGIIRGNDNVPPVPPQVSGAQDDPTYNESFDILWQGVVDAFPNATVAEGGDLVIDRIEDFTTPAKRNNKIGKDYELRIRRTARNTAFVYILETDRKTGERKALRMSPETHSWETFAGRINRAQTTFADPKLHITVSRSDNTEHLGTSRDVGENPLREFLEKGIRPNGDDTAFNTIANIMIDRLLAGEKFGTIVNHLRKMEGTDKDAVDRVAQAFIAQQMAPGTEGFTPRDVHISYDGKKVEAGDRFEWTDHRRYLDWYKPTMRPNPNYRKVYRGTVIGLRDEHSDGKGRRYGDDLIIQFDDGQGKNTNHGSLAAQAIRVINDDSAPLGEPFEAKREELRTPEAIAKAFNVPKAGEKTMADAVPSRPRRPAAPGIGNVGTASIDKLSGFAKGYPNVRVPYDAVEAAQVLEGAEKTNKSGKDLEPGDMFATVDATGQAQIHTVLKVNPNNGVVTSGIAKSGRMDIHQHQATEADVLVATPNWADSEIPDHIEVGNVVDWLGKPFVVTEVGRGDSIFVEGPDGIPVRVSSDQLAPASNTLASKDIAADRKELLDAIDDARLDPREAARLRAKALDPNAGSADLLGLAVELGSTIPKAGPGVQYIGTTYLGSIGIPPTFLARLREWYGGPTIEFDGPAFVRIVKPMKGSTDKIRATLDDPEKFDAHDEAPSDLSAGDRVRYIDYFGTEVIGVVRDEWVEGKRLDIIVESIVESSDPNSPKSIFGYMPQIGKSYVLFPKAEEISTWWRPTMDNALSGDLFADTEIPVTPEARKIAERLRKNYQDLMQAYKSGWDIKYAPSGGAMHVVAQIVAPKNGAPDIFMKTTGSDTDSLEAEFLGATLVNILGFKNVKAAIDPVTGVFVMNAVDGVGGDDYGHEPDGPNVVLGMNIWGPEGAWRMGLADILMNNHDRHEENYIVDEGKTPSERLHPIDAGNATFEDFNESSYFSAELLNSINVRGDAPLTTAQMLRIRNDLVAAMPYFGALGRDDWYRAVLRNMEYMIESVRNMESKKATEQI